MPLKRLKWSTKIVKSQIVKPQTRFLAQKKEVSFDAKRSRLRWRMKQASLAIEAYFIFWGKYH